MDIVLWRAKIKPGKEELAKEWLSFLTENREAGNKTLKNEKEHVETYFTNTENGSMYMYLFIIADDLEYAAEVAKSSGNSLDAKHFEYMSACIDPDDCVQMTPDLALGDFSVFENRT